MGGLNPLPFCFFYYLRWSLIDDWMYIAEWDRTRTHTLPLTPTNSHSTVRCIYHAILTSCYLFFSSILQISFQSSLCPLSVSLLPQSLHQSIPRIFISSSRSLVIAFCIARVAVLWACLCTRLEASFSRLHLLPQTWLLTVLIELYPILQRRARLIFPRLLGGNVGREWRDWFDGGQTSSMFVSFIRCSAYM